MYRVARIGYHYAVSSRVNGHGGIIGALLSAYGSPYRFGNVFHRIIPCRELDVRRGGVVGIVSVKREFYIGASAVHHSVSVTRVEDDFGVLAVAHIDIVSRGFTYAVVRVSDGYALRFAQQTAEFRIVEIGSVYVEEVIGNIERSVHEIRYIRVAVVVINYYRARALVERLVFDIFLFGDIVNFDTCDALFADLESHVTIFRFGFRAVKISDGYLSRTGGGICGVIAAGVERRVVIDERGFHRNDGSGFVFENQHEFKVAQINFRALNDGKRSAVAVDEFDGSEFAYGYVDLNAERSAVEVIEGDVLRAYRSGIVIGDFQYVADIAYRNDIGIAVVVANDDVTHAERSHIASGIVENVNRIEIEFGALREVRRRNGRRNPGNRSGTLAEHVDGESGGIDGIAYIAHGDGLFAFLVVFETGRQEQGVVHRFVSAVIVDEPYDYAGEVEGFGAVARDVNKFIRELGYFDAHRAFRDNRDNEVALSEHVAFFVGVINGYAPFSHRGITRVVVGHVRGNGDIDAFAFELDEDIISRKVEGVALYDGHC